jgi:hypothetical protein
MKTLILTLLVLLAASGVSAQTVSDKQRCYQQSRKYVEDQHKDGRDLSWQGAHYDAGNKVCYVQLCATTAEANGGLTVMNFVEDAFEGTQYATFIESSSQKPTVISCRVGDTTCDNFWDYGRLADKLMGRK